MCFKFHAMIKFASFSLPLSPKGELGNSNRFSYEYVLKIFNTFPLGIKGKKVLEIGYMLK